MDIKNKRWKEIKGYEGKYIISDCGEIISLPRYKKNNSKMQYVEPKEISRYTSKSNGYVYVCLYKDNKLKNIRLHKLVAETYIENPDKLPQINHKDGNKQNNKVENLEWCTCKENIIHSYKIGLNHHYKIKIGQYDLEGNLVNTYTSLTEASNKTGISIGNISMCINGKRKKSKNFIWRRVVRCLKK